MLLLIVIDIAMIVVIVIVRIAIHLIYSNMYATKKNIDRKIDIKQTFQFIGLIAPNLYLAHYHSQPQKKLIVKVIALPHHSDINQLMMQHEAILRKVSASPILYLKP